MANVNKIEKMQLEIERTQNAIEEQKKRLRTLQKQLTKEQDKEMLRMIKEQGLGPEKMERLLKAYSMRMTNASSGKEVSHAQTDPNA